MLPADVSAVGMLLVGEDRCHAGGLDWDPACLKYYERGRVVQTASYDQVTRPIYNSSVGRYKPFEKHLGPLIEALKPLAGA